MSKERDFAKRKLDNLLIEAKIGSKTLHAVINNKIGFLPKESEKKVPDILLSTQENAKAKNFLLEIEKKYEYAKSIYGERDPEYIKILKEDIASLAEKATKESPHSALVRKTSETVFLLLQNYAQNYIKEVCKIKEALIKKREIGDASEETYNIYLEKAWVLLEKACYLSEDDPEIYHIMGDILNDKKENSAYACYTEAIKKYQLPKNSDSSQYKTSLAFLYLKLGYACLQDKNYTKAIYYFKISCMQEVENTDNFVLQGECPKENYFFISDKNRIKEKLKASISRVLSEKSVSKNILIWHYTALSLLDTSSCIHSNIVAIYKIYQEAIQEGEECNEAYKHAVVGIIRRRVDHCKTPSIKEKINTLAFIDLGLKIFPRFYPFYIIKGDYHRICEDYEKTLSCYDDALKYFPNVISEDDIYFKSDIYFWKIKVFLKQEKYEKAYHCASHVKNMECYKDSFLDLQDELYKLIEYLENERNKEENRCKEALYESLMHLYEIIIKFEMYGEHPFKGEAFLKKATLYFHHAMVFSEKPSIKGAIINFNAALSKVESKNQVNNVISDYVLFIAYLSKDHGKNSENYWHQAIEIIEKLTHHPQFKHYSNQSEIYYYKGMNYFSLQQYPYAIKTFREIYKAKTDEMSYLTMIGILQIVIGKEEKMKDTDMDSCLNFLLELKVNKFLDEKHDDLLKGCIAELKKLPPCVNGVLYLNMIDYTMRQYPHQGVFLRFCQDLHNMIKDSCDFLSSGKSSGQEKVREKKEPTSFVDRVENSKNISVSHGKSRI